MNYSRGKAVGNNLMVQFECPPPYPALAVNGNVNLAASSVITLSQNTTAIEIGTNGASGAVMKWITSTDTSPSVYSISSVGATFAANFDHEIPANTVRRFVVPLDSTLGTPGTGYGSVQGANRENNLFRRVAVVSIGIASVLVTEY